ncbi:NAD(P)-binding protein [Thelephora ganbajun]|uniref:NAD(P)-binding protein n=1 Tax=Thelephora ganbajun TaxID=370292 RepID=A0ACB6Z158_THEGA|nr:NAD(P)-binding protein [Thelephora ganbajun]
MKVIILGATGAIGLPIARAFLRAGHIVYGQTRSESKAKQLATEEITPIVCQPADIDKWKHLLANVEAVVHTTAAHNSQDAVKVFNLVTEVIQTVRPAYAAKLIFVETSGTLVHGDNRDEIITDTTPTATPHPFVAWRAEHERNVVGSTLLNGIVIRPVWVIGRSESHLGNLLFPSAHAGEVVGIGTPGARYSIIHQDDLADAYLRVVERGSIVHGSIFDIANEFTESVDDVLATLCKVSGAKGYKYREPANPFEQAACTTTRIRPYLARTLLGWSPRKPGLVDGMETYYATWKASQGL